MSGFETILPAIGAAGTVLGTAQSVTRAQSAKEASAQAAALQAEQIEAQRAQQEKERRSLLERQSATARARLAASGTGGEADGGSAAAILDGIARQGAEDIADINTGAALRTRKASLLDDDDGLAWARNGLDVFRSFYTAGTKTN
jgi:hypothetical protein